MAKLLIRQLQVRVVVRLYTCTEERQQEGYPHI